MTMTIMMTKTKTETMMMTMTIYTVLLHHHVQIMRPDLGPRPIGERGRRGADRSIGDVSRPSGGRMRMRGARQTRGGE